MGTGQMRFGSDNDSGSDDTVLRSQNSFQATLEVLNEAVDGQNTAGGGISVTGGPFGVKATAGPDTELPEIGVHGIALEPPGQSHGTGVRGEGYTGVFGQGVGEGTTVGVKGDGDTGVWGNSVGPGNGVQGVSGSHDTSGVYGENTTGGWGTAGRTLGLSSDRAGVLGECVADPHGPDTPANGGGAGVMGYSEKGWGGVFRTGQLGGGSANAASGGLRVVGDFQIENGKFLHALRHPDGSLRVLYGPLSPESWYEDFGRAELVEGRVEVELDADFVAVLGMEDDSYHVFLTPEGDTSGLYVSGRSATAFTVREQQNGTSSARFSYRIVAKNKHRQSSRLAKLVESEHLTKPPLIPSDGRIDSPAKIAPRETQMVPPDINI